MKYPRWHELNVAYLNTNAVHTAHFVAIRWAGDFCAGRFFVVAKGEFRQVKKQEATFQTSEPEGRIVLAGAVSGLKATAPSLAVSA